VSTNISQIDKIDSFIESEEKNLIINKINEETSIFYLEVIKYFSKLKSIQVILDEGSHDENINNDLFGLQPIKIYMITNSKKIDILLNHHSKKIIFTDYKNFKKNKQANSINSYQYEKDIDFFITNIIKINNRDLKIYCKQNPHLLFSEVSKFLVNNANYISDGTQQIETNHILNVRKTVFDLKNGSKDLKTLYNLIKKETTYKKFSFLTY